MGQLAQHFSVVGFALRSRSRQNQRRSLAVPPELVDHALVVVQGQMIGDSLVEAIMSIPCYWFLDFVVNPGLLQHSSLLVCPHQP